MMCRVYGVTRAGLYARRSRGLSLRAQENAALVQQITRIHQASRRLYGSPRIHHELKTGGVCVGENRVTNYAAFRLRRTALTSGVTTDHATTSSDKGIP
jgi:hypothetical protein